MAAESECSATTIGELNDECLLDICGRLHLVEQIRFSRAWMRFRYIFQQYSRLHYKILHKNDIAELDPEDLRLLFLMCGHQFEQLIDLNIPVADEQRNHFKGLLRNNCPNLKVLKFSSKKVGTKFLREILEGKDQLTEVYLHDCGLRNETVYACSLLPQLKILSLRENKALTGKYLYALENLSELDMYNSSLENEHLIDLCRAQRNLQTLNIQYCRNLSNISFIEMVKYCSELETLKISLDHDLCYEQVALLPNLRAIEIMTWTPNRQTLSRILMSFGERSTPLEYLNINAIDAVDYNRAVLIGRLVGLKTLFCDNNIRLDDECLREFCRLKSLEKIVIRKCFPVTSGGLVDLLSSCPNLQYINAVYSSNVKNDFHFEAMKILKKRKCPKKPIKCYVLGTGITKDILNYPEYAEAKPYLELIFEDPLEESQFFYNIASCNFFMEDSGDEDSED